MKANQIVVDFTVSDNKPQLIVLDGLSNLPAPSRAPIDPSLHRRRVARNRAKSKAARDARRVNRR